MLIYQVFDYIIDSVDIQKEMALDMTKQIDGDGVQTVQAVVDATDVKTSKHNESIQSFEKPSKIFG